MARTRFAFLTLFLAGTLGGRTIAQSMRIDGCNLGCSSGAQGAQVACTVTTIEENRELRIRFGRPVDPASLSSITLAITDVGNGSSPSGTRFVDSADPYTAVFRPSFSVDAAGNPHFGFEPNRTYRIVVPGASQGDLPPYVHSFDADSLPNRSRMDCTVTVMPGFSSPGVVFCAGDGLDPAVTTACPCANFGAPGRGCANSAPASSGARLFAVGSVSPDSVALYATSMPTPPAPALTVFFQGSQSIASGLTFGDGIRCVSGTVVRLAVDNATGGAASYPRSGDPPITVRSAARGDPLAPGAVRNYQVWYRDGDPAFCASPAGGDFNVTNGVRITW